MAGLTPFQHALLLALDDAELNCVLFGGGAILYRVKPYRSTRDLDLSLTGTTPYERQAVEVEHVLGTCGTVTRLMTGRRFHRLEVHSSSGDEVCVVDLVAAENAQWEVLVPLRIGSNIRIPPADHLLADKLLALLGRKEIRDLADAFVLVNSGASMGIAWAVARSKDPGLDSVTMGWVLRDWDIPTMSVASTIDSAILSELPEFERWLQKWLIEHISIDLDEV